MGDGIIYITNILSTNIKNAIPTNVASPKSENVSTNCYVEKVRYKIDYYILHTVLLVIDYITIYNCYYLLSLCKT